MLFACTKREADRMKGELHPTKITACEASAKTRSEIGETLERYTGGLGEGVGVKTYLHGPIDFAKTQKVRFRVGDLDLPERRKRYYR